MISPLALRRTCQKIRNVVRFEESDGIYQEVSLLHVPFSGQFRRLPVRHPNRGGKFGDVPPNATASCGCNQRRLPVVPLESSSAASAAWLHLIFQRDISRFPSA